MRLCFVSFARARAQATSPATAPHPPAFSHCARSCSKKGYRDGPRLLVNAEEVKTVRLWKGCVVLEARNAARWRGRAAPAKHFL